MYNAATKSVIIGALALVATACGKPQSTREAEALYAQADSAYAQGAFETALALLDSIDHAYPGEIATRNDGLRLRPKVQEELSKVEFSRMDSLVASLQVRYDSIVSLMTKVSTPDFAEGYWVATEGRNPRLVSGDGIEGRVTETGEFYMVSSLCPSNVHHQWFTLSTGSADASTQVVPYDGELNYRVNGGEVVTYMTAACSAVGQFASEHRDETLTVTYRGERTKKQTLTSAQAHGLATAWDFAQTLSAFRRASIERERLNRQLAITRDQQARIE